MVTRAVIGSLVASIAACASQHPDYRAEDRLAAGAEPAAPALRVAVLGDFGDHTPRQRRVATALARWNAARPFDLVLQPGDNVYNCGPDPLLAGAERCRFAEDGATLAAGFTAPDDPLFERNEGPLKGLRRRDGEPVPIYLALGNHDVGAQPFCRIPHMARSESMRRRACLEVARRSPQWRIPGRHYVLDEGQVRFVVVDSNVAVAEYAGFTLEAEEGFVREASAPCAERRCFLVAHHPPAIGTSVPPSIGMESGIVRMRRLVAAGGGRFACVFAGHAHTLEHLSLDDLDVFIAGSGSRGGSFRFEAAWPPGARLRFASDAGGFGVLSAWTDGWSFRMVDDRGRSRHCCEASGRGPCLPVACREPR